MNGLYHLRRTAVCGAVLDRYLRSSLLPAMYTQAQLPYSDGLQEHQ